MFVNFKPLFLNPALHLYSAKTNAAYRKKGWRPLVYVLCKEVACFDLSESAEG
jgi:hypothetical protein